jgi:DNA invertase Pin-like site-specific DNA recombinase
MAAFSEMESGLIAERVNAGLHNARAQGKRLGRPPAVFDRQKVRELRAKGLSIRQIAQVTGVKRTSVAEACK